MKRDFCFLLVLSFLLSSLVVFLLLLLHSYYSLIYISSCCRQSRWKLFVLNVTLSIPVLLILFFVFHFVLRDFLMISVQVIFLSMFSLAVSLVWSACASGTLKEKSFKKGEFYFLRLTCLRFINF